MELDQYWRGEYNGNLAYPLPQSGQKAVLVECRELVELGEGSQHGVNRRRIHEVEVQQILYTHRLELQDSWPGQVSALDLGNGHREILLLKMAQINRLLQGTIGQLQSTYMKASSSVESVHFPGPVLPARPALCAVVACTISASPPGVHSSLPGCTFWLTKPGSTT